MLPASSLVLQDFRTSYFLLSPPSRCLRPTSRRSKVRFTFTYQGSPFKATNATLRMLIRNAYQVQDSQIFGGPGWINDDRFDASQKEMSVPLPPSRWRNVTVTPAGCNR